jgi:hypothetical protein
METQQTILKCKKAIVALTCVALGLGVVSFLVENIGLDFFAFLRVGFLYILNSLPEIAFLLYLLFFKKGKIAAIFSTSIFAILALYRIIPAISVLSDGYYGFSAIILYLSTVAFVFTTISVIRNWKTKLFIIISTSLACVRCLLSLIQMLNVLINYDVSGLYLYNIVSLIGGICFFVALFLWGILNEIPALAPLKREAVQVEIELTIEEKLQLLDDKFELGILTEKEYKEQRLEIIKSI